MTDVPLSLDEWRRWIGTLAAPCALVRTGEGTVEELLSSPGFGPSAEAFAPGKPFPPDGSSVGFSCVPAPFLGDRWYWVSPRAEEGTLLEAFSLFLDRVPVPFFVLDGARRIVLANDRFRAAVGPVRTSQPPAAPDPWTEEVDRAFAGETRELETDRLFGRRTGRFFRVLLVPVRVHPDGPPRLVLGTFWEITQLRGALEALQESEARFRALFDCSPEGLLTLSADGFVLQTNRMVCAITGCSQERLRSQHFLTVFPDEERPRLADLVRRSAETGATLRAEVTYRHPEDGAALALYLVVVPLKDLGAERFLVLLQDRSRLRLLESRAEQTERRFEELFQSSPDAVFTCLTDGTLLAFNRRAGDLFRWGDDTVGGRLGREVPVVPWVLVEGWASQLADRSRTGAGTLRSTCSFVDATGLKRTFLVHAVPFPGDPSRGNRGLTVHLHDETESRLLQERLSESREQFRSLVEHSSDLIFQTSPDWRVLYVNPTARTMLGTDPDSLVGRPLRPARYLLSDHCRRLNRIGAEALRRDGLHGELVQVRRPDGSSFWAQLSLSPLVQEGRLKSILGRIRDVDTLFQAQQQLERQTQTLRQTVYQLEEAGRAQEQFAANVTHELRTPLTTILVTSEVLDRYLGPGATGAQRHQLELIRNNARILQDLINDLLDIAKLKRGKFQPRSRDFALDSLLQGLQDSLEPLFARKGLTFSVSVGTRVPPVLRTDEEMLRKVLANLLSNACKFTRQGRVSFDVEISGENLAFRVTDTGPGISPEDLPRIFEEFRQLDSTDARREPGTGLGLSIADRFTSLLGGRIDVTSAEGRGSVFSVILPLASVTP